MHSSSQNSIALAWVYVDLLGYTGIYNPYRSSWPRELDFRTIASLPQLTNGRRARSDGTYIMFQPRLLCLVISQDCTTIAVVAIRLDFIVCIGPTFWVVQTSPVVLVFVVWCVNLTCNSEYPGGEIKLLRGHSLRLHSFHRSQPYNVADSRCYFLAIMAPLVVL